MTREHTVEMPRERPPLLGPLLSTVVTVRALAAVKGEGEVATKAPDFQAPVSEDRNSPTPNHDVGPLPDSSDSTELARAPASPAQPFASDQGHVPPELDARDATGGRLDAPLTAPVTATGGGGLSVSGTTGGFHMESPAAAAMTGGATAASSTSGHTASESKQRADNAVGPEDQASQEDPDETLAEDSPDNPSVAATSAGESDYAGEETAQRGFSLIGGPEDDLIFGGMADDVYAGGGGDDVLDGRTGDDTLDGGPGDDRLHGAGGDDRLTGGPGDDLLLGTEGDDILYGGDGDDSLVGNGGADRLFGLDGNDTLIGGLDRDEMTGNAGADRFVINDSSPARPDWVLDFNGTRSMSRASMPTPRRPGMNRSHSSAATTSAAVRVSCALRISSATVCSRATWMVMAWRISGLRCSV